MAGYRRNDFRFWLGILLWIQLGVILFTIPAGRIAFELFGQSVSFGGNAYKLFTPFLITWFVFWFLGSDLRLRPGIFLAPLAGLALVSLFSGVSPGYGYESLKDALKLILCMAFYCALVNFPFHERATRWVTGAFVAGNLYLGMVVLFEWIVSGQFRAEGTFGHPNLLAAYALLGLPMLLLIARLSREWWIHVGIFCVAALIFLAVLITFSRAAYLGLFVSLICMWRLGGRRALMHLLPLLLIAGLVAPFFVGPAMGRMKETFLDISGSRPQSRLVIWDQMMRYAVPHLPASGWGGGNAVKDRVSYLQSFRADRPPYPEINHAHNLFFHVWLIYGPPGLLALIWLAVRFVRFVPPRSPSGTWGRYGEHAYFFGAAVGFTVFCCFDTLLFTRNVTPALVLFLGMLERLRTESDFPRLVETDQRLFPEEKPYVSPPRIAIPSRPLRILHLYGNDRYTGPAGMVLTVCSLLAKRGHQIGFASPVGPPRFRLSSRGPVFTSREKQGQRGLGALAEKQGLLLVPQIRLNRHLNLFDNLSDIRTLRKFVRSGEWDIIHAHFPHDLALAAFACASRPAGAALVASIFKDQPPPRDPLSDYIYRRVKGVLCVSSATRDQMIHERMIGQEACWVLPGLVDIERFHPGLDSESVRRRFNIPTEAPVAGMISRFQPYRRHDLVVEAWAHVVRTRPDARLLLIGRGENEEQIRRLVIERGLTDSVIFGGYHTDDFPQHVAAMDLLIYLRPGSDGACRTVLEAMAVGIPSLVSPIGALVDLIEDGVNGVICRDERPDALARDILDLIAFPERLREMGRHGRLRAERQHTPERIADLFEQFYSAAMASGGTPADSA
ncbi:MAG TPA: glycosyltransferase [bacterium]|nr:glycosyltransferase [bacterium]HQL61035.1 glycosyltransferase [bacterium]